MTKIRVSYETEAERALIIKCLAKEYKMINIKDAEVGDSKFKKIHITLKAKQFI